LEEADAVIALLVAAVSISSEPPRVQLGDTAKTRLRIEARGEPRLSVSAGRIANLRKDGEGRWIAEYVPPDETVPQFAIVSALAGGEAGLYALPLWGQGDAVVKTRPRARIEVHIGDERFPAIADDTGTAVVPVNVPPGVREAKHGTQAIDLHVPPLRLVHVMLDRDSLRVDAPGEAQVLLFAVGADGKPRDGARFVVHAARGAVAPVRSRAPGIYETTWSFAPGKTEKVALSVALEEAPALTAMTSLVLESGPATSIRLNADRELVVAGEGAVNVNAVATDAAGNPSSEPLQFEASLGEVHLSGAAARIDVPSAFDGRTELRISVHPAGRAEPSANATVPLVPAAAERATIDVLPRRLHADGSTPFALRLRILDRFGNPIADPPPEVTADEGTVAPPTRSEGGAYLVSYQPPLSYERSSATIAVRSGGAQASTNIELLPAVRRIAFSPRLGLLTNFAGLTSPMLAFETSMRTHRLGPEVSVSAEISYAFQNSGGTSADGIDAHAHTDWITLAAGGAWRAPLPDKFHGWLGAGPQLTIVVARTELGGTPMQTGVAAVPGFYLAAGLERKIGRFLPFVEARASVSADPGLPNLRGVLRAYALSLGYRFEML
jgi:hypothetical protein